MKLCAIVLLIVFVAASAVAQTEDTVRAKEKPMTWTEPRILYSQVPFPFIVNGARLPAGHYVIRFENHRLNFRSEKRVAVFLGEPSDYSAPKAPELKFKMTSEGYRLCVVPGVLTNYCK